MNMQSPPLFRLFFMPWRRQGWRSQLGGYLALNCLFWTPWGFFFDDVFVIQLISCSAMAVYATFDTILGVLILRRARRVANELHVLAMTCAVLEHGLPIEALPLESQEEVRMAIARVKLSLRPQ